MYSFERWRSVPARASSSRWRSSDCACSSSCALICSSSDYEQLAAICDRVIVFGRGRIFRELTGAELSKERIVEQCYAAMAGEAAGVVA